VDVGGVRLGVVVCFVYIVIVILLKCSLVMDDRK